MACHFRFRVTSNNKSSIYMFVFYANKSLLAFNFYHWLDSQPASNPTQTLKTHSAKLRRKNKKSIVWNSWLLENCDFSKESNFLNKFFIVRSRQHHRAAFYFQQEWLVDCLANIFLEPIFKVWRPVSNCFRMSEKPNKGTFCLMLVE